MTCSYVWHDSFIRVAWLIHTCDMPQLQHRRHRLRHRRRSPHMCDVTPFNLWHDSFICVPWLISTCDMTHPYVWHDSFLWVTCLIHNNYPIDIACHQTAKAWHNSFICAICAAWRDFFMWASCRTRRRSDLKYWNLQVYPFQYLRSDLLRVSNILGLIFSVCGNLLTSIDPRSILLPDRSFDRSFE